MIDRTTQAISEAGELLDLAEVEADESAARDIDAEAQRLEGEVRKLEFKRMFSGEMDSHSAFLDIQAGAGGYGSPGLGPDAAAHVSALGSRAWIFL